MSAVADTPSVSVRPFVLAGLAGLLALLAAVVFWGSETRISGAVVTRGNIVLDGRDKTVQHRDGGIVSAIEIADGDRVAKGDVLVRLDPGEIESRLDIARIRRDSALALRARLTAESTGAGRMETDDPQLGDSSKFQAQADIFAARTALVRTGRARLEQTESRLASEAGGLTEQISALEEEIAYLDDEIATTKSLLERNLTNRDRLSVLLRERAERRGRMAGLTSSLSRIEIERRSAVLETEQRERALHEEVVTLLQDTTEEIDALEVEIATLEQQLDRIIIRAPVAGIVHEMQVSTVGGVLAPGGVVLDLVPLDRPAEIEARIGPDRIDGVHLGQEAELVLNAVDRDTPPVLTGTVARISPTVIRDDRSGEEFFRVAIAVDADEFTRAEVTPMPGLPVEIYITSDPHTVLSYLLDPLSRHFRRMFRE